jgi:hypothetical protein
MAVSVAPLTTTVMSAVAQQRAGIASGINNAVSRVAGLLAIAVFGIVILQSFNHALDVRLADLNLPPAAQALLDVERAKLAGADVSRSPTELRASLRAAIDRSFVDAFRRVMLIGAVLAFASAVAALALIDSRPAALRPES